jgi:hypothetical protein
VHGIFRPAGEELERRRVPAGDSGAVGAREAGRRDE